MSWKKALYNYVHAKNQAELEYDVEPLAETVADGAFLRSKQAVLQQARMQSNERKLKPIRHETKLQLGGVMHTGNSVIADIVLRRQFHYRLRNFDYIEERTEREQVTLDDLGGKWLVRKSVARTSEKSSAYAQHGIHLSQPMGDTGIPAFSPSVPYINHSILNNGEFLPRRIQYDRAKAVQYAEAWWNKANPNYIEFEVDCTNYVSQCLFAGGAPMNYTGKREAGWWYTGKQGAKELWSFSWAVAHSLQMYVATNRKGLHGTEVSSPGELLPGDIISYDWDGDGRYTHSTIVTGKDVNGMPLVNAHTYNARMRYWAYLDSPAWTQNTKYVFMRIANEM